MPPVHGGPLSGYGTKITPQALLWTNVLPMIVSLRAPDTDMPVPTGPGRGRAGRRHVGLLLSCT